MKRFLAFALALVAISVTALWASNDRVITFQQLPAAAQQFVNKHFSGRHVSLVKIDREYGVKTFEVRLADGTEIDFDSNGQWKDVDGNDRPIPTTFIPAAVLNSLKASHPNEQIVKIKVKRPGYQVELSSDIEVLMTKQGKIVGYDD